MKLSSRRRMLMAMEHQEGDYLPCCFMIFRALREKCKDQLEFVERQLELGLDAKVDLPQLPIRFQPDVKVKEWKTQTTEEGYPLLHKKYCTPAGTLTAIVEKTADWPYGDHVPFFDDYLIPRSEKFLVHSRGDLDALRFLFAPPTDDDIRAFGKESARLKQFAAEKDLLVAGGWGGLPIRQAGSLVGQLEESDAGAMSMDAVMWLCGMESALLFAIDEPGFLSELLQMISDWNRKRMEIILDVGVDLLIRRAWYESTDLWSPTLYRKFMMPILHQEIELTHQAGAKFGYIITSGMVPLLDDFVELGFGVLIGVDPVQGKGTDMAVLKQRLSGKICLWGGVNAFLTVEKGTHKQVQQAVRDAIQILAPGGGFILSPVDNIRDNSNHTWNNVMTMIEAWKRLRAYPIPKILLLSH